MKTSGRVLVMLALFGWLVGCASQPQSVDTNTTDQAVADSPALDQPGIATFRTAAGTDFTSESIVTLPTGGPPAGRLLAASTNPNVALYVTRDGSVPSADNNWGGRIDPSSPRPISRALEGVASYRVVAELEGAYSDPFTLTVKWKNEENPTVAAPTFSVNGKAVSGSITVPTSDGSEASARLAIASDHTAATFFITRDGTDPTVDNFWKSQVSDGTYIWSPEPTEAEYRVIAVWQGSTSPVATITVQWK